MQTKRHSILILARHYLPGFKGGGPIQSIANIVEHLGDEFDFKIITGDRDFKETTPYPNVKANEWNTVGKAQVFYMSPRFVPFIMHKLLCETSYDLLYLNDYYHPVFAMPLWMRRFSLIPTKPILVAPRNELNPNFIKIKAYKKMPYIYISRLFGIDKQICWHATNQDEASNLSRLFLGKVFTSPVLPTKRMHSDDQSIAKIPGEAKLVYLSRVNKTKNLKGALYFLSKVAGKVTFDIFGPAEDSEYLNSCLDIASSLPRNIECKYKGPLAHEKVRETLAGYQFFYLPTFGENFGHVIWEALSSGCIPIISDQTPWKNLEDTDLGWALPLSNSILWQQVLQQCVEMDMQEFSKKRRNIFEFVDARVNDAEDIELNRNMFLQCMGI